MPGVGISIGLTRLFFVLREIGFVYKYNMEDNQDYLIIPIGDTFEYCGAVLQYLQSKGYGASIYFEDDALKRASIYFEDDALKKKMNYANKIGVENVILIGEEEVENNEIRIKNMKTGDNITINYDLFVGK